MIYVVVAIAGFLVLSIWSVTVFLLGFALGKLAQIQEGNTPTQTQQEGIEATFSEALNYPAFSRLIQTKPLLKDILIAGSMSSLYITDNTIEIAVLSPQNHEAAINQALEDALEVNFLYEI